MDTKHISEMEAILDEANEILDTLDKNLNRLNDIQAKIQKLENYYTSKQWIDDFTADEQGLLPQDLKRGVLSEDGISSMLERNKDYMERIIQRQLMFFIMGITDGRKEVGPDFSFQMKMEKSCLQSHMLMLGTL